MRPPRPAGSLRASALGLAALLAAAPAPAQRPQLNAAVAAQHTAAAYLAQGPTPWQPEDIDTEVLRPDFTVAADGSGTHASVQAAVDAVPAAADAPPGRRWAIRIAPGVWRGPLCVRGKAPLVLMGTPGQGPAGGAPGHGPAGSAPGQAREVVLLDARHAGLPKPAGTPAQPCQPNLAAERHGTSGSATVVIASDDVLLAHLTIANDATGAFSRPAMLPPAAQGEGAQAVALMTVADRVQLVNLRLVSHQDTFYVRRPAPGAPARVLVRASVIEGDVDVVFGNATLVIDDSSLLSRADRLGPGRGGHVLAPSTPAAQALGFLVQRSRFLAEPGLAEGGTSLGRAWDEGVPPGHWQPGVSPNGQALVRDSLLGPHIGPAAAPWAASTARRPFVPAPADAPAAALAAPALPGASSPGAGTATASSAGPANPAGPASPASHAGPISPAHPTNPANPTNPASLPAGAFNRLAEFGNQAAPADLAREVAPFGWATAGGGTRGGADAAPADVHTVRSRAELVAALAPHPRPRIVQVQGRIDLATDDAGRPLGAEHFAAPGFGWAAYAAAYDPAVWGRRPPEGPLEELRRASARAQAAHIVLRMPSRTTLIGLGADAQITGGSLLLEQVSDVIVRNLYLRNAFDHFPAWDPADNGHGEWNAEYDNLVLRQASRVWIDHCSFDGRDADAPPPTQWLGRPLQHTDGLLDITRASQFVTVSWSHFRHHDKTALVGGGDRHTDDAGRLQISYHHNRWQDTRERSPRVRYGQVHLANNLYQIRDAARFGYSIGLGHQASVWSQHNAWQAPAGLPAARLLRRLGTPRAFDDQGSQLNGEPLGRAALLAAWPADAPPPARPDWLPPQPAPLDDATQVPARVRAGAGAGRLPVRPLVLPAAR